MLDAQKRILISILFGAIMVAIAFWHAWSQEVEELQVQTDAVTALGARKHIPVTDSDNDGVLDWQNEFIDPNPIYLDASSTEPYVPSNTVTGRFSTQFYEDTITLENLGLLEDTKDSLISNAISELELETREKIYTEDDVLNVVTVSDPRALRAYGNLVAGTIFHYQTDEENEFEIFTRLTRDENPKHFEKLKVIEQQYEDIITALLELEVPEQYVFEHITIVNSFSALRENVVGMQLYFEDPFYTVMRYRRIVEDVMNMNNAIISLYDTLYLDEKIRFAENEALPVLVELLQPTS